MATSVNTTPGWGAPGGVNINSRQARQSGFSTFDVTGGASPLLNVYGILPTAGNPLGVTQAATPAMKVTVIAGKVTVPNNTAGEPGYSMTLEANTDLDIATSHVTNPRIDLVIARVVDTGSDTSTYTIEILTGTPAAVPTRPTLPSGTSHCISLATVTVGANVTTIVNANITKTDSDTWTTATSDAGYMAGVGGCVVKNGLMTMSATRRQAWAAQRSSGTTWWDQTNRAFGIINNGVDIVPLSTRKLYEVVDAATVQTSSTTPVSAANSGTLTVFGGTRRIRITATGKVNCNGSADTRWMAARVFLTSAGSIVGVSGEPVRAHTRVWGGTAAVTIAQQSFCISGVFDAGAGTFSVTMQLLRVDAGGAGVGDTVQLVGGCLLIEDIGPA